MADDTMTRRTVYVPDDLWARAEEAARALADETGLRVTVSDLVRRGLEREIERIRPG